MSILKSKRKASQFEVFHQLTKLRKDITDLLLRDFGYSYEKCDNKLQDEETCSQAARKAI